MKNPGFYTRRQILTLGAGASILACLSGLLSGSGISPAAAQSPDNTVFQRNGLAIDGYDSVAYFTEDDAIRGKARFQTEYKGAIWQFASAANRDLFIAEPEKYAPRYEGYCAYAAAQNYVAKTEPDQWSIVDGKLYLNYNFAVKLLWDASQENFIAAGDKNWPAIRPGVKTGRPL